MMKIKNERTTVITFLYVNVAEFETHRYVDTRSRTSNHLNEPEYLCTIV